MPEPEPPSARYSLNIPVIVRERLRTDGAWLQASGLVPEFAVAMREIEYRLVVEPDEWGESRERLEYLDLQMWCGTSRLVTVLYGVDVGRRIVVVKEFRINHNYRPRPTGGS